MLSEKELQSLREILLENLSPTLSNLTQEFIRDLVLEEDTIIDYYKDISFQTGLTRSEITGEK